jgi:N-acetylglutamate synthase-like GNAT family acetyltransferase
MPHGAVEIRPAARQDVRQMVAVLDGCDLRSEDICADDTFYLVATLDDRIVGTVGIENAAGSAVLLRSLAVLPELRSKGIGARLMSEITSQARTSARTIYLFSTGAGDYYQARGYVEVPVDEVVSAVGRTPQVRKYEDLGWLPTEVGWRLALSK